MMQSAKMINNSDQQNMLDHSLGVKMYSGMKIHRLS